MMTKQEALKKLERIGSHVIVSVEWANKIGAPFGLTFTKRHFSPNGNPKGPLNECDGVDVHLIASRICESVGGKPKAFYGRGSQFREDIQATHEVLGANK